MKENRIVVLIGHNIRSAHNVGSLIRTAEGLALEKLYLSGYSPYPLQDDDTRLPYLAEKINKRIQKTSLGSEKSIAVIYAPDIAALIKLLKKADYEVLALEQDNSSVNLADYVPKSKVALIVGNEVDGIDSSTLALSDMVVEIPMLGRKESFNVAQAAAMALYHCRFMT